MKKPYIFCCLLLLLVAHPQPGLAKTTNYLTSDQKLADLTQRFHSLESSWSRFQLGGSLELDSTSDLPETKGELPTINFTQNLKLYLDTFIQEHFALTLKMSHAGDWGLNYQNSMKSSPLLDEAFLRAEYPTYFGYLGRFRFSMSPMGLISDFSTDPAEGIVFQKKLNNLYLTGVFSRINYGTDSTTNELTTENYFAGRINWVRQSSAFGINFVPDGLTGEKGFGFDWSINRSNTVKLTTEIAWYSFHDSQYPDYQVAWTPGFLLSYAKSLPHNTFFQVKTAYLGSDFKPSYSSLAHSSGGDREWFVPNSKGVEFYFLKQLKPTLLLENRLLYWNPVVNYDQADSNYRLRCNLIKNFSSFNQLLAGVDFQGEDAELSTEFFLQWNLKF